MKRIKLEFVFVEISGLELLRSLSMRGGSLKDA